LIHGAPEVDADGPSAGQALGRHQQHRAAAAADIEQPFVSFELEPIEQVGPDGELARAGGVGVDAGVEKQPDRGKAQGEYGNSIRRHCSIRTVAQPPQEDSEQAGPAEDHEDGSVGGVEAVVAATRRGVTHGEIQVTT
jgi:hypothetical protein